VVRHVPHSAPIFVMFLQKYHVVAEASLLGFLRLLIGKAYELGYEPVSFSIKPQTASRPVKIVHMMMTGVKDPVAPDK